MGLVWKATTFEETRFFSPLKGLFDHSDLKILAYQEIESDRISRKDCDGIFAVVGKIKGKEVGILYNDFRVKGGSFGVKNSKVICTFLDTLGSINVPVIFALNSIGARLTEGRKVFPTAFQILPALKSFSERSTLVTISMGRCLGLGALFFEIGDYRLSLESQTLLNLTGPEVINMFFKKEIDFAEISNPHRQMINNKMIHKLFSNKEELYLHLKDFFTINQGKRIISSRKISAPNDKSITELQKMKDKAYDDMLNQITSFSNNRMELFDDISGSVRVYLVSNSIHKFGVFINPPGYPNMIDISTINKYRSGLRLFAKLGLPIISVVDTPGADPRAEQNDQGIIHELNELTKDIISYPHHKISVVNGRCFGGASVLTFPTIFGGEKSYFIKGSKLGIMDKSIIENLLENSEALHQEWKTNSADETEDLEDLNKMGILEKIISLKDLSDSVNLFLKTAKFSTDYTDMIHIDLDKFNTTSVALPKGVITEESYDTGKISKRRA